jgi:hypothetical protein
MDGSIIPKRVGYWEDVSEEVDLWEDLEEDGRMILGGMP